jgi:predicted DNA-binding WGR domain protein
MPEFRAYLELSEEGGGSHKFYEVVVQDTVLNIRYGRIGDNGQSQTKSFPTFEKAKAEADKKIREKTNKGYEHSVQGVRKKRAVTRRSVVSTPSRSKGAPVLWQFNSGSSAFGIFVDDGLCWVGNQGGHVYAVDHTGQVKASFKLPDGVKCLVADADWLYAGCDDGNVYDLTGKVPRVAYEISESVDILWIDIRDGVLGVGDTSGQLSVFNHEDETCWAKKARGGYGWMVRCDEIGVYLGSGGTTAMYDWEDGRQIWEANVGGSVLFGWQEESSVYAACSDNRIYKLSKKDGAQQATYRCDSGVFSCATAPDGRFVFAGDNSSSIYCFDESGNRLWKMGSSTGSALSMQFHLDRLYVVTTGGALACIDVRAEAIAAAEAGNLPSYVKIEVPSTPAVQAGGQLEVTTQAGDGVVLECVLSGGRPRVRALSAGYRSDWWVQFPKDVREVGARYVVESLREADRGGFYRCFGAIRKLA